VATIVQPAGDTSVAQGGTVSFSGTVSDPDNDLPLTIDWQFPSCATPPSSNQATPGAVVFNCAPGNYTVELEVCDTDQMCDSDSRQVTVLGPCETLPQSGWSLLFVDSQETVGENGAAVNAFDGSTQTKWHTRYTNGTPGHPHQIGIDLGAPHTLCGFSYLPRQDGGVNGTIRDYEFAVSANGVDWTTVASGVLVPSGSNLSERSVSFAATPGRYVRLRSLSAVNNGVWASAAEIRVKGSTAPSGPQPPLASIDQPATDASVAVGGSLSFSGTASDPDDALPLSLAWTFPACATPSSSNQATPGAVVFDCTPGNYTVSFEVCDADELCTTDSVGVTVAGPCEFLSQSGWTLAFVDSQETVGENGAAVNAFDGNPQTKWHTAWSWSTPQHPHQIGIDLGANRTLCGFSYLPRQDGGANGTIRDYEFAVSTNGVNWTTVASGVLVPNSSNLSERTVSFAATPGRYVRLRSLSAVNNGPWATAAEIRVKGQ
jgi:galactose oxidase